MGGRRDVGQIGRLLERSPRTVSPTSDDDLAGKNFDVRGVAQVTIEFPAGGASGCDYSWTADPAASGHGYSDDGAAPSTNVTATTTKVAVAGSFLRVDPTGGDVIVHLLA